MKALGIIAIFLGIASLAANGYAVVETLGNYESLNQQISSGQVMTEFDRPLLEEYRDTLAMLAYTGFGAGVVAAIVGILAGVKKFPAGWVGAALGVAGAIWQFTWAV